MTQETDSKAWRFIQHDHEYARRCRKAGLKVIPYDSEDAHTPAYEVWATQAEMDRIWSQH